MGFDNPGSGPGLSGIGKTSARPELVEGRAADETIFLQAAGCVMAMQCLLAPPRPASDRLLYGQCEHWDHSENIGVAVEGPSSFTRLP
ncbi:MAG: hypothetical protein LC648_04475, partial [Novosphingobium sp.]|nr:hypothetical protein [Novosphingobium sp.]